MHEVCGIMHLDIKPSNIMFADKERTVIKVVDFGMAKLMQQKENDDRSTDDMVISGAIDENGMIELNEPCGSPHYTAPECICMQNMTDDDEEAKCKCGKCCDIWSAGLFL